MSVYELGNPGARQEDERSAEVMGGYPYGNMSVIAMAKHLNKRIYGDPKGPLEAAASAETELPASLEGPEAEAA